MEQRTITIISTRSNERKVLNSTATTLGELKVELRQAGIDYSDMTFYEGLSKTELLDNSSVLPSNIPYKDTTTNNLAIMLTNSSKKIKSGIDYHDLSRAELYMHIKEKNLQSECLQKFGKNFTTCKCSELISLLESKEEKRCTCEVHDEDTPVIKLLIVLERKGVLSKGEVNSILGDTSCPYTEEEIDEMFNFL